MQPTVVLRSTVSPLPSTPPPTSGSSRWSAGHLGRSVAMSGCSETTDPAELCRTGIAAGTCAGFLGGFISTRMLRQSRNIG